MSIKMEDFSSLNKNYGRLSVKAILSHLREKMIPVLIQTQSWILQPKLWRFLGFGSSIIGLFCYAFSSSFNHLFGQWTFLKIFLYSIFSLIISLTILFPNTWQHSRSHRFKAHSAFLVLTITTVYSFLSDKVVNNGIPDAYSLISSAAFAIMSVSLSRQIQCGFEVDLLYFFLGCLMMQLMKIKLQLVIVGACFSYCLIILRSSFSSMGVAASAENVLPGLVQDEQVIVIQVDSSQHQVNTDNCSITQRRLMNCMKELQQNNSNLTYILLKQVKEYIEDNSELAVTDHNFIMDALPPELMNNLQETAKLVVDAGLEKEFSEAYSNWWREFLEECLINKVLGLRKMGFQDYMIGRWIKASKVALRIIFPGGRRLWDQVFSAFSSSAASDLCFSEVCRGAAIQLLNFANAFANRSPSAWRLFRILDMFQALDGLIPQFQSLFTDSLVNEAMRTQKRLGEASRDIFMEFANLIFDIPEADLDAWDNGGVHLMTTIGVTEYLIPAFWSRQILEQILLEFPISDGAGTSSFSLQMEWIMEQFEGKLEDKSKIYKDPALCYFFMMNNMRYIDSQLGTTLGDDRFQKKAQQNFELYCRSSWSNVLEFLKLDIDESWDSNVAAKSMIEKLNLFYQHFKEVCGVQSTWRVCDKQLRKQIIESVENMLLPAYRNFIEQFKDVLGRQSDEFIKYEMCDIQGMLNSTICFVGSC
ncbi:exocyst complex component EXO70B1-like [Lotus japonicus]|uniref:exocyst complex component EXO70B1-like n=1 Tax=Lotus japonicus TaxID=34305 RepID=UPI00258B8247|nr:exocyst complex component EXO70B1-like [Lotus japonicus]